MFAVSPLEMDILVVEDDPVACNLLEEILVSEGHTVTKAADGLEARRKISENAYDLLITDFSMPGMNGLDLLKEAKGMAPDLHVILMTASTDERVLNEAVKLGAYVISKPLGQPELIKIVKEVLRQPPAPSPG
jgi:CheY-like chemotaxis protein